MKTILRSLKKPLLIPLVAGAALLNAPSAVQAAPIIDETFNHPVNTLPDDWTTPGDSVVVDTTEHNGVNQLRFTRPSGQSVWNQVIYYNGTGTDNSLPDSKIADFEASVIINTGNIVQRKASTSAAGMIVKSTDLTSYGVSSGSYFIGFSPAADPDSANWKPGLGIWTDLPHNPPTQYADKARHTDAVAFQVFEPFLLDMDVLLKVTSSGASLMASLWTLSDTGEAEAMIASVSINNAYTDAGYIGLRAAYGNTGVNTYYRDFQVTAIPEPGSALLLSITGLLISGAVGVKRVARNRRG